MTTTMELVTSWIARKKELAELEKELQDIQEKIETLTDDNKEISVEYADEIMQQIELLQEKKNYRRELELQYDNTAGDLKELIKTTNCTSIRIPGIGKNGEDHLLSVNQDNQIQCEKPED